MSFSVIIPALNEGETIDRCLSSLVRERSDIDIIVVDGGSEDATATVAAARGGRVISAARGRGTQLNAGANASAGDVLVFLHADTEVPTGFFGFLEVQFQDPSLQCGAFRALYDGHSPVLRLYSWFTRFETRFTTFGDQCLVVRRPFFERLGGFPAWPLFEDMEFLKRARKATEVRKFRLQIITSARKFRQGGTVLQQLRNIVTITLFHCGVSSKRLYKRYYGKSVDAQNDQVRSRTSAMRRAANVEKS